MRANLNLLILMLASAAWSAPVHVTMQGLITSISVDSMHILDSLGLRIGSVMNFSVDVDYQAQPVNFAYGQTSVIPDDTAPDGQRDDYFACAFQNVGLARSRVADTLTQSDDYGQMHWNVVGPSQLHLQTYRGWGTLGSTVSMIFPSQTGMLADTNEGYGAEIFERDTTPLLQYSYNIQNVQVVSNAILPPRGSKIAAQEFSAWPGIAVIPYGTNSFQVNGRRLEMKTPTPR